MSDPWMPAQASKVARPSAVTLLAAAVILSGVVLAIALPARRANSATWDETMYLSLGQRALVGDGPASLAALGVAPLPVRLVWTRGVFEPLSVAGDDPGLYRQRVESARLRAI